MSKSKYLVFYIDFIQEHEKIFNSLIEAKKFSETLIDKDFAIIELKDMSAFDRNVKTINEIKSYFKEAKNYLKQMKKENLRDTPKYYFFYEPIAVLYKIFKRNINNKYSDRAYYNNFLPIKNKLKDVIGDFKNGNKIRGLFD